MSLKIILVRVERPAAPVVLVGPAQLPAQSARHWLCEAILIGPSSVLFAVTQLVFFLCHESQQHPPFVVVDFNIQLPLEIHHVLAVDELVGALHGNPPPAGAAVP
jgi:hypothetical protein